MRFVTASVLLLIGAAVALLVERLILTPDLFNPIIIFMIGQQVLYTHILGPLVVGITLSLLLVPLADFAYWNKKRNLDLEHAKLMRLQEIASSTSEALERILYSENQLRRISSSDPRHPQLTQMNADANALLMKNRIMLESYFSQPTANVLDLK